MNTLYKTQESWWFARLLGLSLAWAVSSSSIAASDPTPYRGYPAVQEFIGSMVKDHGFEQAALEQVFGAAKRKQSILDAIARPAEKTKEWWEYRNIFIKNKRIAQGKAFMKEHRVLLENAEQKFGVPKEIIVAILGVETRYGRYTGGYRVIDALTTLSFDYPARQKFFRKQLVEFLLLAREENQNPLDLMGSYAGAMGYGQFMPSSYRAYAIDFDGDDKRDIWSNPADAVGSIANYLKRHGWKAGQPIISKTTTTGNRFESIANKSLKPAHSVKELSELGVNPVGSYQDDMLASLVKLKNKQSYEYWMGFQNFYVISRYNHSRLYSMAVFELSQLVSER
ncbi:MAG: lytic murein transglycosylase B [Pseudomonadales bacterium]|nr:lytic murein transglycosylase B [Pseudomonadales bacterium]